MAGRKGVIYTLVAIILLLVIGNIFFSQSRRTTHESFVAVEERVRTVNGFLDALEEDSGRAAYIAGFRTLIAMEQHVTTTGRYLSNPDATFRQIFLNGTYNGTNFVIMENSTFSEYLARVQYEAAMQGILFNVTVLNITLWQTDPWHLLVNYTLELNVTDGRAMARWSVNQTLVGTIPITDIRDPLYSVNTNGRLQRTIRPTNATLFVNDTGNRNDTTALQAHFNNSFYAALGRGPKILDRFANITNDSVYGIESLVDINELVAQGIAVHSEATVVDYKYFNGTPTVATACNIQNLPARIKFDSADLVRYNIAGTLNYTIC